VKLQTGETCRRCPEAHHCTALSAARNVPPSTQQADDNRSVMYCHSFGEIVSRAAARRRWPRNQQTPGERVRTSAYVRTYAHKTLIECSVKRTSNRAQYDVTLPGSQRSGQTARRPLAAQVVKYRLTDWHTGDKSREKSAPSGKALTSR